MPTWERRVSSSSLLAFLQLDLVQAGAQDAHGAQPVLQLRALVLAGHDDAGGNVGDAHGGGVLLHVLPAGARGAVDIHVDVRFGDVDLHFIHFSQHDHGDGGGVNASLGFGERARAGRDARQIRT